VVILLMAAAIVILELWRHPPPWLGDARQVVVDGLHWVRVHWATSAALGVVVGALGVVAALLIYRWQRRAERQRDQREAARQARAVEEERARLLAANCWVDETTGWLPRVGQVTDPVALGIHPAAEPGDLDAGAAGSVDLPAGVPVYVPRDKDAELDAKLARGGLVLVVGDSTAGKSRAAYEAIRRLFAQRWLLVPHARQSLRRLLDGGVEFRDAVVWLNDLERWLSPDGLDLGLLRRLLGDGQRRVVVAATMRASEYVARTPEQEQGRLDPERELRWVEREVLDQAARVELARRFTRPERERAEQRAWDPRIADALAHAGAYGLAEYLAAGPRLWQRWRGGLAVDNPSERLAGAAIVAVAVDCRRAGLTRPVPEALLRDLYLGYVDTLVGRRMEPGAFALGLAWATTPIQATSALLSETEQGYVVFDYLVDQVQMDPDAPPILEPTWARLLSSLEPDEAAAIARAADRTGDAEHAERAWRVAAAAGHGGAEIDLGLLLLHQERVEEAESWLRKAATAGRHDAEAGLGLLLLHQERVEEAESWLRKAATAPEPEAALDLPIVDQGHVGEVEQLVHKAAIGGDHAAAIALRRLLVDQGRVEEFVKVVRKAATASTHTAQAALGMLLVGQGRIEEGEEWLRKAAAGSGVGANGLMQLLIQQGRAEEANQWLGEAAAGDHGRK
jgi:tetratricopeptide (TPR) repeat protein